VCKVHQQIDRSLSIAGLAATIDHIYTLDGVTGFYKGYTLTLLCGWINDFLVNQFNAFCGYLHSGAVSPICEAGSQIIAHSLTYPLVTLRTRFIISPVKTARAHLRDLMHMATDDPQGFVRGLPACILQGLTRLTCGKLLAYLPTEWTDYMREHELAWFTLLPILEIAIETVAYPFGTVSRLLEVQRMPLPKHASVTAFPFIHSTSSLGVFTQLLQLRGAQALWAGVGTSALTIAAAHTMLTSYIYLKDAILSLG